MTLFGIIDMLFVFTRYLVWLLAVLCVPVSAVLAVVNLPIGFGSAVVFVAALLLGAGVAILLAPEQVKAAVPAFSGSKLKVAAVVCLLAATAAMGATYYLCGGFPALNLLFV